MSNDDNGTTSKNAEVESTENKVAVVTGAGRGLGLEFARQLLERGYRVIGAVRTPAHADALRALGEVDVLALDVADVDSLANFAAAAAAISPRLDLLVNNAGINSMSAGIPEANRNIRFGELEPEGLLQMVRVNAIAPILVAQALSPLLERTPGSRVVHISSWLGSVEKKSSGGNYGYCGSKATLNMLGRALAFDLVERGVVSAMFNPGWVQTDMGGKKAKLTPRQSVGGILNTAFELTLDQSGQFLQWDGSTHPW